MSLQGFRIFLMLRFEVHPVIRHVRNTEGGPMRGSRGGGGVEGVRTHSPLEFAMLNIADITGNEKNSYFSYLGTSTVIRQTESNHKITVK